MVLVSTRASRRGHVHAMQIDAHKHTCVFVIMRNLERMQSRRVIYPDNCTTRMAESMKRRQSNRKENQSIMFW